MKRRKHDDREMRDRRRKQVLRRIQEDEWMDQLQGWKGGGRLPHDELEEEGDREDQ